MRKLQKKRELQKKWNERKRKRDINNIGSSEDNDEDSHSKAKVSRTESPHRIPIREKKAKKTVSTPKQKKINKNLLEETTPLHEPKVKLRQTKLNFQTNEATNSNTNEMSLFESKLRNRPDNKQSKIAKLITSTPLHKNVRVTIVRLSPSLELNNITSIGTKKTANKLNDSKNGDQLGNKNTPEKKTQEKSDRLLRNSMKATGLSQVLKTNQRMTRSKTT